MSAEELNSWQDKIENADKQVISDLLGSGFNIGVSTPATVAQSALPNLTVAVSALLGRDQFGNRLSNVRDAFQNGASIGVAPNTVDLTTDENAASTAVGTPGNEKIVSIFVEFERSNSDSRTDGNSDSLFFDNKESVKFNIVQSAEAALGAAVPPVLRSDQLLLADVTLIFGQSQIFNADIDQTRRQDFDLELVHGTNHVETGTDPIPNATTTVGGLLSAIDKAKLDDVDFTSSGISALFNNQAKPYQPSNVVAPSATSMDVTGAMLGKTPGGSSLVEGVVTAAPNNRVILKDEDLDDFVDGGNNKVFGRITESSGVWTLSFFVQDEISGEIAYDMTPYSGQAIVWYVQETFSLENLPTFDPSFSIPSDQLAAEYPFPIKANDNGGSLIGAFSHIQEGDNVTFSDLGGGVLGISTPDVEGTVPVGTVIVWWRPSTATPIPSGYVVADGQSISNPASPFNGQNVPNLQDKFIRGINTSVLGSYGGPAAPASGGSDSHSHGGSTAAAGDHAHTVNAHTHTVSTDGSHDHGALTLGFDSFQGTSPSNQGFDGGLGPGATGHNHRISSAGSHNHGAATGSTSPGTNTAGSHAHGVTTDAQNNIPAYIGLLYLIKIL